jgi:hypothetical protein
MRAPASRRTIAFFAIGFLLFGGTASAYTLYRCAADGETRSACCCPTHSASDAASVQGDDEGTRIEAGCCCDRETHQAVAPDAAEKGHSEATALPVVTAVPLPQAIVAPRLSVQIVEREHWPAGPPLLLQKQSFLL